tara:strand:+ start:292 stop:393 length:102 start_codon:yes stop_codon:yes gene_type:complete
VVVEVVVGLAQELLVTVEVVVEAMEEKKEVDFP